MKKLHYSKEIRNDLAGRKTRPVRRLTKAEKDDLFVLAVWGTALLIMAAACAVYIGLL